MPHAILSPSAATRWLTCTRSARVELQFPNVESEAAREGTLAHAVCECLLRGYLVSGVALLTLAEEKYFKTQEFYDNAMLEHCRNFALYVLEFFAEGDILYVEEVLDLNAWAPESFGTSDAFIVKANGDIHVFDYKFGKGVPVSAHDNKQMKLYALGILSKIAWLGFNTQNITLHIYQPRISNNSIFEITFKDLMIWAVEIYPLAVLAFKGEGEFVAGNHCFFCNAKAQCKAMAEYNLELLRHDFKEPELLEDDEILEIFERKKIFESWIKAVCDYTLESAVKGKPWENYKLVNGKANRQYKDESEIARVLHKHLDIGYISEIYKPKELLGITELTKKLGAENFNKYVEPLLLKPAGAPTLVPSSDPRPAYSSTKSDFSDGWDEYDNL